MLQVDTMPKIRATFIHQTNCLDSMFELCSKIRCIVSCISGQVNMMKDFLVCKSISAVAISSEKMFHIITLPQSDYPFPFRSVVQVFLVFEVVSKTAEASGPFLPLWFHLIRWQYHVRFLYTDDPSRGLVDN